MDRRLLSVVAGLLLGASVGLASDKTDAKQGQGKAAAASEEAATVGDLTIRASDIEEAARDRLVRLRSEEYVIKKAVLDELVVQALFKKEAGERGIGVDELLRQEIASKIVPVTPDQAKAVYETNPEPYRDKTEAEALSQITANLKRLRETEARRVLLARLKAKTPVRIHLDPPRLRVDVGKGFSKGPKDAPVTIVEFSDFQCPYCARVTPTLKRLQETYADKVRLVFRHFPLAMHKQAAKAAEAAECAGDQDKFWPMHDKLFEGQAALQVPDLKRRAADLGLDLQAFSECLDSGTHAAKWQADMAEGQKYGVRGTPAFFVNGRSLTGAQTAQAFTEIIDDELARLGSSAEARVPSSGRSQK